jgi:hypothetical protein
MAKWRRIVSTTRRSSMRGSPAWGPGTRGSAAAPLEYDPQAGRWSAVFPNLPGCASAGDTEEEAVANAKEALALWFDSKA